MAKSSFKLEHPLERRTAEAARIREKYPDRIPVIVEKAERSDIPDIDKKKLVASLLNLLLTRFEEMDISNKRILVPEILKAESCFSPLYLYRVQCFFPLNSCFLLLVMNTRYLVPADLTVGQFVYVVRKRIKLSAEKAIFIFVKNILPPTAAMMSAIYEENKDEDGFLYMTYSGENTFGSF
ncbi:hypothetical protein HHK36_005651 [Tetracentron sinense]|uniref:Autophagy-related protein n=1 Tax=Tetracentron sinense TaxID=13715 RepID=A0A835DMH4_TETSI|nr:hypothetical protein HHK36_005651 [Tetracentron sinense]